MFRSPLAVLVALTSLLLVAPALPAQAADEAVATTTTLTATSPYPQRISFTVAVSAPDGSVPTGAVEVREGEDLVAAIPLADGSGFAETSATPGEHTYVATYVPDAATWTTSSSDPQTVAVSVREPCGGFICEHPRLKLSGQKVFKPGQRFRVTARIGRSTGTARATGSVTVSLRKGGEIWTKTLTYRGRPLRLQGPRLRRPGLYKVVGTFDSAQDDGAGDSEAQSKIAVRRPRR